ncbi:MAG TPA: hypothetical protein VFS24_12585 [Steroidobacteraceae bacterium]|nr:hypothetical protein [Steroidobacteraceae bacterium]
MGLVLDEAVAGDILFALVRSPIGMQMPAVIQCPYSHTLVYLGNGRIVEGAPGGVRVRELNQEYLNSFVYIDLFRFRPAATELLNMRFLHLFCELLESATGTLFFGPYRSIFAACRSYVRTKWLRRRIPHRRERVADRPERITCASLISWAIHRAACETGNIEIVEARGLTMNVPAFEPWNKTTLLEIREKLVRLANQSRQYQPQIWHLSERSIVNARHQRDMFLSTLQTKPARWGAAHQSGCVPSDLISLRGMRWIDELEMALIPKKQQCHEEALTRTINARMA